MVLIRCWEMRVDTPNPLWAWCVFSVQPRRQSMLIAASFRPADDSCATIIWLIFSDADTGMLCPMDFRSKAKLAPSQSQSPISEGKSRPSDSAFLVVLPTTV